MLACICDIERRNDIIRKKQRTHDTTADVRAYDHISSHTMNEVLRGCRLKTRNISRRDTIRRTMDAVRDGKVTMDDIRRTEIVHQYDILRKDVIRRREMHRQLQMLPRNTRVTWVDEVARGSVVQRFGVIRSTHARMGYRIEKVGMGCKPTQPNWNHNLNEIVYVHPRYIRVVKD